MNVNNLKMQEMKQEDIGEVSSLLSDYWKDRDMPEYNTSWARDYLKQGHRKEIAKDEFFVCKYNGKVIGVVALVTDVSGVAEIRDMVLKKEWRNKGLGKEILKQVIEIAKNRRLRKIFALALPHAEKLYSSAGFEKEGMLKSHFKDGENLSIMSLFLRA